MEERKEQIKSNQDELIKLKNILHSYPSTNFIPSEKFISGMVGYVFRNGFF